MERTTNLNKMTLYPILILYVIFNFMATVESMCQHSIYEK